MLRYLHYARHYQDMRVEAGYHLLDKSKVDVIDQNVRDLKTVQKTLHKYKGLENTSVSKN